MWRLASGRGGRGHSGATTEAVKTRGNLTTNDGEIAVNWALEGHGILMRAEWDIERYLRNGRLVNVLPQYHTPDPDIHAVYPQRHQLAARVRASRPPYAPCARKCSSKPSHASSTRSSTCSKPRAPPA